MNRITPFGSIVLVFALLLSGCDQQDAVSIRLTGWIASPIEETLTRTFIDTFEQRHPGLSVRYEPITANYMDKLLLMLATGTAPDVIMIEAFWIPLLVEYDVLLPLDDWVAGDPDFASEDFEPVLLDAFRSGGALYGLPKDYSTLALYYNPDMFEEAGLAFPPRNWDEFVEFARRLTRDTDGDARTDQYGYGHAENLEYSLPFVWQNEGEFIDRRGRIAFTEPAFVEALNFLRRMKTDGIAVMPSDVGAAWNMDAFGRRRVAMAISGLWAVNFLNETYASVPYRVALLPVGKRPATVAFAVGYGIPKRTRNPELAWRLLRYLTGPEGGRIWVKSDIGLPARRSVAEESAIEHDPVKRVFLHSLDHARIWQFRVNQRILDETQSALQAIFLTDADVQPMLDDLRYRVERRRRFYADVPGDESQNGSGVPR
ncbi:ABC transporter substrate-binding protein [Methylocaldum szegediense]|jgi:multiple sugar transport system substrate-binding protein|uniref:sn-glycerol-3-phosphate-binding periplasmic protein UgpB n=1 Tax=Methylocaldum szegediense TaxID=73780 RepID=A0ABM9I214_9GAMM|nr:ABC transporter substrate-binding protein [Methylocaldum szegediense]CAI8839105.1 multiple sugar transport system substrate-binding protein [Methylocaldum szegediense]